MSASPVVAGETDAGHCADYIYAAMGGLAVDDFVGRRAQQDYDGVMGKLVAAGDKLDAGKPADAVKKLRNASTKLDTLSRTGKARNVGDVMRYVEEGVACITPHIT